MPDPINGLNAAASLSSRPLQVAGPAAPPGAHSFEFRDILFGTLDQMNQIDQQSQAAIVNGLAGDELTQAEMFTSVKKADLALRTMLQIRNKIMDAYNEIKQLRM